MEATEKCYFVLLKEVSEMHCFGRVYPLDVLLLQSFILHLHPDAVLQFAGAYRRLQFVWQRGQDFIKFVKSLGLAARCSSAAPQHSHLELRAGDLLKIRSGVETCSRVENTQLGKSLHRKWQI